MECGYERCGCPGSEGAASSENEAAILRIISRAVAPSEQTADQDDAFDKNLDGEAQCLAERWEQFSRLKEPGNSGAFARRLEDLGLTRGSVAQWLHPKLLDLAEPLPRWALLAKEMLEQPQETAALPTALTEDFTDIEKEFLRCDPWRNTPLFPRFLGPFVTLFLRRLRSSAPVLEDWIYQSAVDQIARSLLIKLSAISARTLAHEVKERRSIDSLRGDSPSGRFQNFESDLASTAGRKALFEAYPVLLRLLATVTLNMLDASVEMLDRFRADHLAIGGLLGNSSGTVMIRSAIDGLSDPHRKGRAVWLIELSDDSRVIYKPRSVAIDAAYAGFLDWLNSRPSLLPLRCARVLVREGYGWCEFIHAGDCGDRGEIARYFRRQGMHVAIIHFLCGNDFHEENFIADGEWPVPIDLEGLLTAREHVPPKAARDLPPQLFDISTTVALTTLLPRWYAGTYGTLAYSISGIDGTADRVWPMRKPLWHDIGTDQMRLSFKFFGEAPECTSRPRLNGTPIGVEPYLDDVLQGFRDAYAAILESRDELLENRAILAGFRSAPNRTMYRDSREYHYLLFWATSPDLLKSGAAQEVALEMVGTANRDPAVVEYEKRCLWERDLPHFSGIPCSVDIWIGEDTFTSGLETPSFDQMIERIRSASEEQLDWQAGIVEKSFRMALPERTVAGSGRSPGEADPFMKQAMAIGDALEGLAIKHRMGCSWLSLYRPDPASPSLELMHPQPWMTSGAAGTALFLAGLAKVSGESRFAELAKSALRFTFGSFEVCSKHFTDKDLMKTGLNGAGLVIYSLASCARSLEDEEFRDMAVRAALTIPLDGCRQVRNPDVLNGASGLLLAILALYREQPDPRLFDRARGLGAGIAECQEKGDGSGGWTVPGMARPLLGMAHGAAGIAMALWRLHLVDGDRRWVDSVRRGLDYERRYFRARDGDWPNLQAAPDPPRFMTGWCGGAPGIGLARLSLRDLPDSAIDEEIEAAISATVRNLGTGTQNLCCGEAGRIVFLESAGRILKRPDLTAMATASALRMIDTYAGCGFWRLQHFCERNIVPGLLDGIGGIGMALLRAASPEPVPNVLTME